MSSRSREGSRPPCGWPIWAGRHEPIRASARPARCLAPSATRTLTSGTRSTCAASSKTPKAKPGLIPASRLPSSGRAGPPSRWPSATRPSAIAPAGHYGQQHRLMPLPAGKLPAGADPVPPGQSPGTRSLATRVDQPRPAPGTARLHPSPARRLRRSASCLRKAVSLFGEFGDRHGQAQALAHLSAAQLAAGQPELARDSWQRAVAIPDDLRHPAAEQVRAQLRNLDPG